MAQQLIDYTAPDADTLPAGALKINENFTELYTLKLDASAYTAADVLTKIKTVDGAGSGLDADTLDGISSAGFVATGSYTAADVLAKLLTVDGAGSGLDADLLDGLSSTGFALAAHVHAIADVTGLTAALAAKLDSSSYTAADVLAKLLTVDGAGSGIDADTLDGISSAGFVANGTYTAADVLAKLLTVDGTGSGLDADLLDGVSSAGFVAAGTYTAADVLAKLLTVDGSGSGLDADLLDGISSAGFLQTSTYQALTPTWAGPHRFDALVKIADGSAAAPSLAFTSGISNGFYKAGTDSVGISTGGLRAAEFSATGGMLVGRTGLPVGAATADFLFANNGAANFSIASLDVLNALAFTRYNGSMTGTPTEILTGQFLTFISFAGYSSSSAAIYAGATIGTAATETWSGAGRGTRMSFSTTDNGAIAAVTSLIFQGSQSQFRDGSAAAPAVTFQSNINAGLYRIASNRLGISCNSTNVLDLSTSLVTITATTLSLTTTTATTIGAAGAAAAMPTPSGYIACTINGASKKIAYFNV